MRGPVSKLDGLAGAPRAMTAVLDGDSVVKLLYHEGDRAVSCCDSDAVPFWDALRVLFSSVAGHVCFPCGCQHHGQVGSNGSPAGGAIEFMFWSTQE